jgi:hypothetical protein
MPGLDNTIPQSDSSADNDPEMNMPGGHDAGGDREGAMAKADLFKLANYSHKLYQQLEDEDQLEAWVQAKITKAADYIASVYHYLAYEMKFTEYAHHLDNSDTLSEGQKRVLSARLTEAKMKMKEIKKAQADKMKKTELDESMVDVCGHCGGAGHVEKKIPEEVKARVEKYNRLVKATKAAHKRMDANHNGIPDDEEFDENLVVVPNPSGAGSAEEAKKLGGMMPAPAGGKDPIGTTKESFDEKSKVGDTKKTRTGVMTKTDTGVKHTNTSYHDDGEAEEKSGKGVKSHAKAQSAAEKKDRAPALKQSPKSAKTWGMKDSEKFDNRDKVDEAKKADKDYDQDGKIESGKDEYLGSRIRAAKKAGKLKEGTCSVCKKDPCVCKKEKKCNECGMFESKCKCSVMESKPSAGLSKAKKSATVKDAKAGKDIGKPGKGFKALAKKAGGGEKGEKIAAAAMWKNIKETTAYLAEKKKKEKMTDENLVVVPNPSGAKDAEEAKKLGAMMPKPAGSSKDPISESDRLRELTGRLNRAEKPMVAESREVDQIRALTKRLLG